jgi:hypothetical protein
MIFGLEKKKLLNLYAKSEELHYVDTESIDALYLIFKEYTQIVKKLHSKEPNIFGNIHKYGLAELKRHKEMVKTDGKYETFSNFKAQIESSMEDSLQYMQDYLHV